MADYLADAIKAAQQQALAENPYAQFGSSFAQTKNPYASKDPWENIAAAAAQSFLGGTAMGYGKADVANDFSKLAPVIPDLYLNPDKAVNPGMDSDAFNRMLIAAKQQQGSNQSALSQLIQEEKIKNSLNPQLGKYQVDEEKGLLELLQMQRDMQPVGAAGAAKAAGDNSTASLPPGSPTKAVDSVSPVDTTAKPSALKAALEKIKSERPDMTNKEFKEVSKAYTEAEIQRETNALKTEGDLKADLSKKDKEQDIELKNQKIKDDADFDTSDQAIKAMGNALNDLPDYSGPFGSIADTYNRKVLAQMPKDSEDYINASRKVVAAETIGSLSPIIVAPIRKSVLSGATSDFDVQFLLRVLPNEFKLGDVNKAVFGNLKAAADIRRAEKLFRTRSEAAGLSQKEIVDSFNQVRNLMGGSFLSEEGTLKPQFNLLLTKLGSPS